MSKKALILDAFDHGDIGKYQTNHHYVKSYSISLSSEKAKYGKESLKVTYHFGDWITGNGAMMIGFKEVLDTTEMPCKLGVWIHSDGKTPWLRAGILDGDGERKTIDLTAGKLSWTGWKYLDASIDPDWSLPLQVEQIYAVETDKTFQGDSSYQGVFYMDQLRYVYIDDTDLSGPEFTHIQPEKAVVYKRNFIIRATITDAMSGVNPESIRMKINGVPHEHTYCAKRSEISYEYRHARDGDYRIEVEAFDFAGNKSVPPIDKTVIVDLSPDKDKPILHTFIPMEQGIEYTNTPRITFNLLDEKSGIDPGDIKIQINHEEQDLVYDEATGWGYAISRHYLTDGENHLTLSARDRAGNKLGPIQRTFIVKSLPPALDQDEIKVSIIPDVHSFSYAKHAFTQAEAVTSDFIIQMGDVVDLSLTKEYEAINQELQLLDKPYVSIPGNHESFQGDLSLYVAYFGATTWHLAYGNTLFIFLNTAYEQSILASDSTQFTYLKQVLDKSREKHIVLITHVPTRDRFGTSHEMNPADADQLERILEAHKRSYPKCTITALFGHLHVIDYWRKNEIDYIITGNSARKGYTSSRNGNIVGYGILKITNNDIIYHYHPYVSQLSIKEGKAWITEKSITKDRSYQAHLIAKINMLETSYQVDITAFSLIHMQVKSSNPAVAQVSEAGWIHARDYGRSIITFELAGKQVALTVKVVKSEG